MKTVIATAAALAAASTNAQILVDDFDGNGVATSFVVTPSNGSPSFPNSIFDVFGVTNRTVNFDFADDSLSIFTDDMFGVLKEGKTDNVFGVEDLANSDNTAGGGTATWTVDISGLSNLELAIDFAAMGDFEAGDNSHLFTYSIDGGTTQTAFDIDADNDLTFDYILEGGAVVTLDDPLVVAGQGILSNDFATYTSPIVGSGSTLTITYTAGVNNGGSEVFVFDNLVLIPTPASAALLGLGGLAAARRRR